MRLEVTMNTPQKQFILMSHAAVITLILPLFGFSSEWINNTNSIPASIIHPTLSAEVLHQQVLPL